MGGGIESGYINRDQIKWIDREYISSILGEVPEKMVRVFINSTEQFLIMRYQLIKNKNEKRKIENLLGKEKIERRLLN